MNDKQPRLYFIDNLRWLMIILVVLMHVNVTYSMLGGWYYIEKSKLDLFQSLYFGMYGSFVQAFFMGFLFFIAGYFVPGSYDRKGFRKFSRERMIRLGVPTLLFMLIIHPFTVWVIMNHYMGWNANFWKEYAQFITSFKFLGANGPLWFALALLIFSLLYAVMRKIACRSVMPVNAPSVSPKHILTVALAISALAFLLRIPFPIGTNVLNMQFCFFAQYIILFITGIVVFRKNLLQNISYSLGMKWFKITLIAGVLLWLLISVLWNSGEKGIEPFAGGFTWGNAVYATWESFFCVGVCLGMTVWFREKFNKQGRLLKFLSDNAFGVYVFHTPVLVFISMLMKNIVLYPFFKYALVAIITIPLCFLTSHLLRKIPGVAYLIK
jgi:glucans biosynthesis protein C